MAVPLQASQPRQPGLTGDQAQVVDDGAPPTDTDVSAHPHAVVAEGRTVRGPSGSEDLQGHEGRRRIHLNQGGLPVGGLPVGDDLVGNELQHGPGPQAHPGVLADRAGGGAVDLSGRLGRQHRRGPLEDLDLGEIGVAVQVPASGIDHVVGHLPGLVEVQRAENPQCSPVVLLDGDAPVPAPGDPQVQLAGGAHDSRSVMSTSWWIHSMTCSRPSSVLRLVKQKGLSPRNTLESASMTARSAPT